MSKTYRFSVTAPDGTTKQSDPFDWPPKDAVEAIAAPDDQDATEVVAAPDDQDSVEVVQA